jgi:uncharacterized membrane protein
MVAGPGLIVNVILKDNFGRPRPRNIIEFSGKYEHEKPLVYDASSPGKSFPCGHASMGFYFLGVYILYRRRRQFLANLGLVTGIFWGGLIGITRMLQGGHFFSDVIYSAGLIYLTALILYHSLKFSPDLKIKTREISTSKKRILTAALSILIILFILGVLLATPRNKSHTVKFERSAIEQAKLIKVDLHLLEADFQILQADSLYLRWQFEGFGFPKSNIRHTLQTSWQDSIYVINLEQYIRGHFTELQQSVRLYLPESTAIEITGTNGDKEIDY